MGKQLAKWDFDSELISRLVIAVISTAITDYNKNS